MDPLTQADLDRMTVSRIPTVDGGSLIVWTNPEGLLYTQEPFGQDAVKLTRDNQCVAVLTFETHPEPHFVCHPPDYNPEA